MGSAHRWLTRASLDDLLDRFAREGALVAPVRIEGEILFRHVASAEQIARNYVNSLVPPKEHFLPSPERLASYRVKDGVPELLEDADGPLPDTVIFGIRSCDVAGLAYLERFLSGEIFERPDTADRPFFRRREAATLISVVCSEPGETCMCVCCQGGPALTKGYDWQLTELAEGWLVEIGSARGERLAARCAPALVDAPADALAQKDARVRDAVQRLTETSGHRVRTMVAGRMVSTGKLDHAFWEALGERCFECGGCAFVCPTCSCFNVADLNAPGAAGFDAPDGEFSPAVPGGVTGSVRDGTWDRVRLRDCCILPGFIRQAGGGYPRESCGERCVTRFFHKLSQQFSVRMDAPGCTGCGRCLVTCLGDRGIDRVSELMVEAMTGSPSRRKAEH